MKKLILFILLAFASVSAFAQTVSVSYPFVNPFGQKVADASYVTVSYGHKLGDGSWSFFGLAGSSVEDGTRTIAYSSFSKSFALADSMNIAFQGGDFRSVRDEFLHWANVRVSMAHRFDWGIVTALSDIYFPLRNSSFMNLSGINYETRGFGPRRALVLQSRIGWVNYGGWQWDSKLTFSKKPAQVFLRGVVGFDSNLSIGTSWMF